MENINEEFDNLVRLIKMIAEQFGGKCQVVLHDLTKSYDHTIVAIENNHITGRNIGDCGSNLGLSVLSGHVENGDVYNYVTQNRDGTFLRSSTMFLKNSEGVPIGSICINFDISDFLQMENAIKEFTLADNRNNEERDVEPSDEIFAHNVNELLDYFILESKKIVNKDLGSMTKEDKIKIIAFMDQKGAFQITKAGEKICDYLNISKFTLYNYLDIARNGKDGKGQEENGIF